MGISTHSMIYLRKQPVRKRLAARRATAELAIANSREHNNAEGLPHERSECFGYDRFPAGPQGTPQIGQCASPIAPTVGAVLVKGMPFPADCPRLKRLLLVPWSIWDALQPKIYH
jgi:hypothetical protein